MLVCASLNDSVNFCTFSKFAFSIAEVTPYIAVPTAAIAATVSNIGCDTNAPFKAVPNAVSFPVDAVAAVPTESMSSLISAKSINSSLKFKTLRYSIALGSSFKRLLIFSTALKELSNASSKVSYFFNCDINDIISPIFLNCVKYLLILKNMIDYYRRR